MEATQLVDKVHFAAYRRQEKHFKAKEGALFCKKVPLFQKQFTGLFLKFTPETSAALGDFAVCGRRPGLSALDLTIFLKKAGPKTFAFASRF